MYYHLHDSLTNELLGSIRISNKGSINTHVINISDEIYESWEEFNKLEEHDLDPTNVDEFVEWHNDNRVTEIERINFEAIQPFTYI